MLGDNIFIIHVYKPILYAKKVHLFDGTFEWQVGVDIAPVL